MMVLLTMWFALTGSEWAYKNLILNAVAVTFANLVGSHGRPRFSKNMPWILLQIQVRTISCFVLYYTLRYLRYWVRPRWQACHMFTRHSELQDLVSRAPSLARRLAVLVISSWNWVDPQHGRIFRSTRNCIDFVSGCVTTMHLQLWFWDSFAMPILLAKQGSFLSVFLFWQYIRMSVMLEQTRGTAKHFTSVFQTIDTKVSSITIRGPSVVLHHMLLVIMFSHPRAPAPGDSNSSSSAGGLFGGRCVVM